MGKVTPTIKTDCREIMTKITLALDDVVRDLIIQSEMSREELTQLTLVPSQWFYAFLKKENDRPNFKYLQVTYEALTGKPLIPVMPKCRISAT